MKTRIAALLGAFVLLVAAVPAGAGTLYLALAKDQVIDGVRYETELKVTNPTAAEKSFTGYFIATNVSGVDRPENLEVPAQIIGPGKTVIYRDFTSDIPTGMLEITADPELVFSARIVPVHDGIQGLGAPIEVIHSDDVVAGGNTMHILGLRRDQETFSSFGMINISQEANECRVQVKAASGQPLTSAVILGMPPLSQFHFSDVLGIIDAVGSDMRIEATCNREAFVYGHAFNRVTAEVAALPMADTGASLLAAPGVEEPCPPGGICFEEKGVFHAPRPGNEVWLKWYRIPPGEQFSQLRVRLTVFHGGWDRDAGGLHNFFWLARNTWKSNTFAYVNARGGNKNLFQNTTNVDLTKKGETQRTPVNVALRPGTTYTVDYTYDAAAGRITTILTNANNGAEVARIVEPATIRSNRIVAEGEGFFIETGLKRIYQEVPTYGWQYSDLRFELIR